MNYPDCPVCDGTGTAKSNGMPCLPCEQRDIMRTEGVGLGEASSILGRRRFAEAYKSVGMEMPSDSGTLMARFLPAPRRTFVGEWTVTMGGEPDETPNTDSMSEIERIRRDAEDTKDDPHEEGEWARDCLVLLAEIDRMRAQFAAIAALECDCGGLNPCAGCQVKSALGEESR